MVNVSRRRGLQIDLRKLSGRFIVNVDGFKVFSLLTIDLILSLGSSFITSVHRELLPQRSPL